MNWLKKVFVFFQYSLILLMFFFCLIVQCVVTLLLSTADTFCIQHASTASGCTTGKNAVSCCTRVSYTSSDILLSWFWLVSGWNIWYEFPTVLWHCWLDVRKSIWPVKIEWWGVDVVICLERGADCFCVVQLIPLCPKTPSYLASFKSRLVLPFWCRLIQVVLEKDAVNLV